MVGRVGENSVHLYSNPSLQLHGTDLRVVSDADIALMDSRAAGAVVMLRNVESLTHLSELVAGAASRHAESVDYLDELTMWSGRYASETGVPARSTRPGAHAQAHGVSWPTVHRAFVAHAEVVLTEPAPTPVLGIDETRRGSLAGSAAPRLTAGYGSIPGTPGSSIWPAIRGFWDSMKAAAVLPW